MLPLKKIFPVIIALITLSLLGIIYIQVSWIRNAAHIKKEQREQRMQTMTYMVASELYKGMKFPLGKVKVDSRVSKDGSASRFSFDPIEPLRPITSVSDVFEARDVYEMIKKGMIENKMDTVFEFGINNIYGTKLYSPGFKEASLRASADANNANLLAYVTPIADDNPASGQQFNLETDETLVVIVPESSLSSLQSLGWMIFGSVLFTAIIITAFALTIRTMFGQKKLSEIKSDFINNMTHELKTPLATISLAIDAIGNEKVMDNREKIRYFSGIIKEENKRMNKQVESILQSALLEKEELTLNLQPIDIHQLITSTVENLQLQLDGKNGKVYLQLNAHQPIIKADEVHISNLIFNLLDNAIKYSKENLEVRIATGNTRKSLIISVADNGIGMSRDTVSRIFEKFYRAHTGNVHNVKGFGLGLSYVKAIVDAHKGKIRVESVMGKGSRFTLEFPQD
ncbi:sensor histidine kinase [Chitinophaga cymbidii]|uniref:histidine kinase n=1 Tax=Chitinophaga cymbidii TaxID=1096750 RepID=A0A512RF52_9BACT|nr:HAMP domain-containing sensor histidine kinase [Chitinophaga cymbidii]GEP94332.1 hypothetical protein CCY01nite_05920 [Chitinophaga cymbidii]